MDPNYESESIEMPAEFMQSAEDLRNAEAQDCFGISSGSGPRIITPQEYSEISQNLKMPEKRKISEANDNGDGNRHEAPAKYRASNNQASLVASHYNNLDEKGLQARSESKIFYMRNFNNWIKSILINEYIGKIKENLTNRAPIRVLDMCCGKGGDLLKWQKANITHLICTDIADVSIEQCESRYKSMKERSGNQPLYTAEFIISDNTNCRLRERYKDPSIELNLVSCQFAFHYCFESLKQAECMLKNAAECLRAGGYFIGTIPDAYDIMKRQHQAKSKTFGNDIYDISFLCDTEYPPLFGAKYNFQLDGVVNCPEFLVHFPLFVKLARKYGLELIMKERFEEYFQKNFNTSSEYKTFQK